MDGLSTVSFGTVLLGQSGPTQTFTVTNTGGTYLTLASVALTGGHTADYVLETSGMTTLLGPGASTTFTVAFRPIADGLCSATLQITSNDADETPFDITLSGTRTSVDPGFNPNPDSSVYSAVAQPDGKILLGGAFTTVGGTARNYVARINPDGSLDAGFDLNANNTAYSLAVQADGKILLGGDFASVGGATRNRIARLNPDGTLDAGFDPDAGGAVRALAVQADGKILAGGLFHQRRRGDTQFSLARLNADGTVDMSFNPNPNNTVFSVAVQADGKILFGGSFTAVGGTTRNYLARLNADGTLDTGFNPNANNTVFSVAVQADGKILVGGSFTAVGGTTRNHLARLTADGTLDPGFDPNASDWVMSTALQADGKILVGGIFTSLGGTTRNHIARLNADGTLDLGYNPDANSDVYSVALQPDGQILLGGSFTAVGGAERNGIARMLNEPATQMLSVVDATQIQWLRGGTAPELEQVTFDLSTNAGSTWTALGTGTRVTGGWAQTGVSLPTSGTIRARGRATAGQLNGSSGLVEQSASYSLPTDVGMLMHGTNLVDGVSVVSFGGVLLGQTGPTLTFTITNAGAAFLALGTVQLTGTGAADYLLDTNSLAVTLAPRGCSTFTVTFRPSVDGLRTATLQIASNDIDESPFDIALSGTSISADPGFNPDANSTVVAAAVQPDGRILLGGGFTALGGTTRNHIARLNADGSLDAAFDPNANNFIHTLAVQADGRILLGGNFTSLGGVLRNHIARLKADGTLDTGFNPNASNNVYSVAVQADGRILLGGSFTTVGGTARNRIARVNADGSLDPGFNPNASNSVYSVAVQADGKILLGGSFTAVGGTARNRIARINADGTLDPSFDPNVSTLFGQADVSSITVQADGKILLGGRFTTVGSTTRFGVAQINADGTLDPSFDPNVSGSLGQTDVSSITVQADGKILLGGHFTTVGGTTRNCLARVNADGSVDASFNPNASSDVYAVALQADGEILVGGSFTSVGGTPHNRVARLLNGPATQTLNVPDATQAQWLRGGTAPEVELVTFELSTDGGSTWAALGSGARISGGWTRTGLSLPPSGFIRARGRATAGHYNGSSSLIEQVAAYSLPPVLIGPNFDSGQFQFTLVGPTASLYIIEATTNLSNGPWQRLCTNHPPFTFGDPEATNYSQRFYRAVTP